MEAAVLQAKAGSPGRETTIAEHALAYAGLLREHIVKEDGVLYPLAERIIPTALREDIVAGYAAAEARVPAGFTARYEAVVRLYEREPRANGHGKKRAYHGTGIIAGTALFGHC
jgi:hypothetical protein